MYRLLTTMITALKWQIIGIFWRLSKTRKSPSSARHGHAGRSSSSVHSTIKCSLCQRWQPQLAALQNRHVALATTKSFLSRCQWCAVTWLASKNANGNTQQSWYHCSLTGWLFPSSIAQTMLGWLFIFLPRNAVSDASGAGKSFALLESKDAKCNLRQGANCLVALVTAKGFATTECFLAAKKIVLVVSNDVDCN